MKKEFGQRLDEMESRLGEKDSADADSEQLRAAVAKLDATVDRRVTRLQDELRHETADKCSQLEKVCIGPLHRRIA